MPDAKLFMCRKQTETTCSHNFELSFSFSFFFRNERAIGDDGKLFITQIKTFFGNSA